MQPAVGHRCEDKALGAAGGIAQPLVDRLLPQAPEGVRVGVALAGLAGAELARLGPRRRLGLGDQRQRVEPGRGFGKQLLAFAGLADGLFPGQLEGRGAAGVTAFGNVGRGAQGLGLGVVQAQQHPTGLAGLAGQQQPLGQAQAGAVVQHAWVGLRLGLQPQPQGLRQRLAVATQLVQQAQQQAVTQLGVDALPEVHIEGLQQCGAQQRGVLGRHAAAQQAQPFECRWRAAGKHHHPQRADHRFLAEQLQVPAVVEAVQPAPAGPPAGAGLGLAHQCGKTCPAGLGLGPPLALGGGLHCAGLVQLLQPLAQLGTMELGAARRAVVGQQFGQPGDVDRRLHEGEAVEDGLAVHLVRVGRGGGQQRHGRWQGDQGRGSGGRPGQRRHCQPGAANSVGGAMDCATSRPVWLLKWRILAWKRQRAASSAFVHHLGAAPPSPGLIPPAKPSRPRSPM